MKKEDEGEGKGELPQAPKAPPSLAINNFVGQYYQTSTFHHLSSWKGVSTKPPPHRLPPLADNCELRGRAARLQEFTSNVASGVVRPDVSELKGVVRTTTTAEVNSKEDSPAASQASQTSSPEDAANQRYKADGWSDRRRQHQHPHPMQARRGAGGAAGHTREADSRTCGHGRLLRQVCTALSMRLETSLS